MPHQDSNTRTVPDAYYHAFGDADTGTVNDSLVYGYWHRDTNGRFHHHAYGGDHADHRDGGGDEDRADRRTGHGIGRLPENYVPLICIVVTAMLVAPMFLALGFMLATRKM